MPNASPAPLRRPAQAASPSPSAARPKPVGATTHDEFRPTPPSVDPSEDWSLLEPSLPVDTWRPSPGYPTDSYTATRRKIAQVQARIDRDLQGVRQALELRRQEHPWSLFGDEVSRSLKRAEDSLLDARGEARDALEALDRSGNWGSWRDWSDRDLDRARDNLDDLARELGDAQRELDEARRNRPSRDYDHDYGREYGRDPRNPLDPNPYDDRYATDRLGSLLDTLGRDVAAAARQARDARDDLGRRDIIPVDPWPRPTPGPWPIPSDPWPRPGYPDRPNPRPPRNGNPIPSDPWPRPGYGDRPTPPPVDPRPGRPGNGERPGYGERPGNGPVPPPVNDPGRPNPRQPRR